MNLPPICNGVRRDYSKEYFEFLDNYLTTTSPPLTLSSPDVPQLEAAVVAPGGQHSVVVSEGHTCDLVAKGMGGLHLETYVDKVFPVVPHLDAAVITNSAN